MSADLAAAGLGLQRGTVRLVQARDEWTPIGEELAAGMSAALSAVATTVAHIGSTAVPGLLAKPVIDVAVGVNRDVVVDDVAGPLTRLGWTYRGDAGHEGGWVFVLEDAPWRRVAHAHCVEHGGQQWVNYLHFRDLLRSSAAARRTYEATKRRLAERHPDGRREYTAGKTHTVQQLLAAAHVAQRASALGRLPRAWLGLSDDELLDAFGTASGDDAGRGPAGLSP